MTVAAIDQKDHGQVPPMDDWDWDLDVSIVESGPVVADLMRITDDGCGVTCQSACTSCR